MVHMRIFDHYEIYNKETDEVYMIGYSDLLAHRNLKKYRDEYGEDPIGIKMFYKELD